MKNILDLNYQLFWLYFKMIVPVSIITIIYSFFNETIQNIVKLQLWQDTYGLSTLEQVLRFSSHVYEVNMEVPTKYLMIHWTFQWSCTEH